MTDYRIKGRGRVDHGRRLGFTFDGKPYDGLAGDTLASALLANGVYLVSRSFKYHRPRGILSAGSEETNALVGTRRSAGRYEPNTRATMQELREGLAAESQNRWPSLGFDVGAVNDNLYTLFAAGFYYKTFMWPKSFWDKVYEPVIRASAGIGKPPTEEDPDHYASRFAHCDVLVIGAGPAGHRRGPRRRPLGRQGDAGGRAGRDGWHAAVGIRRRDRRPPGLGLAAARQTG